MNSTILLEDNDSGYLFSDEYICCYELMPEDKIWSASKEKCIELEQQLQKAGYKTKIAQSELGRWTIAILEDKE